MIRSGLILFLSAAASVSVQAQAADPTPLRAAMRACDMRHKLLTVPVQDAAGAPVTGATIRVRRIKDGVESAGSELSAGVYQIAEDGIIPNLAEAGEPFDVIITAKGRTQRVRVTLGMDEKRCHIARLDGAAPLRF
jgi:hypothetical protein